ncbi:MAG: radical SAM protein [Alphaproteobacteria bacterium]|nr:radical SAM protein [Alphaproteobacteria bacterium]
MRVKETFAKSVIHYHDHAYSTNWDINLYRGCEHKCIYCFAQYSHKYLESDQFFDDIIVKTNVAEALNTDFSKRNWEPRAINLCGVTDPYQPLEKKYELMPKIIETFIRHKNPMIITTKSTLLMRDLDLLEELNKSAFVEIRVSASVINENIRNKIEPLAAPTIERLEMLSEITKRGIDTGVLMMPIIPYLTDNIANLSNIFQISKENGANFIIPAIMHLRGETKKNFYNHIDKLFPNLRSKIEPLYRGAYVDKKYLKNFSEKISLLRNKYNFYNKIKKREHPKKEIEQLNLL